VIWLAGLLVLPGCKNIDAGMLGQIKGLAESSLPLAQDFAAVLPKITAKDEPNAAAVNRFLVSHQASLAKSARAWANLYKAAQSGKLSNAALKDAVDDAESSALELRTWNAFVPFLNVNADFAAAHTQALADHEAQVQALAEKAQALLAKAKPATAQPAAEVVPATPQQKVEE
jgi:hypothetical protein